MNALPHFGIHCLVKEILSASGGKKAPSWWTFYYSSKEGCECCRFNADMKAGTYPRRDIRGHINQRACWMQEIAFYRVFFMVKAHWLTVNMFELLNRLSNYRTVNHQTEGALEDNSCCLRGGKHVCGWLCDRNMLEWREVSERKRQKKEI